MSRISDALFRPQIPTALLVDGDQDLFERCQAAAVGAGIVVKACPASMAPALAAERRPLVVLVTDATYAGDPHAIEALAGEVPAALVRIAPGATELELEGLLSAAVRETRRLRASQGSPGRYVVLPGDAERAAAPPSSRQAPPSSRAKAQFHLELDRVFDERGLPRAEPWAD